MAVCNNTTEFKLKVDEAIENAEGQQAELRQAMIGIANLSKVDQILERGQE